MCEITSNGNSSYCSCILNECHKKYSFEEFMEMELRLILNNLSENNSILLNKAPAQKIINTLPYRMTGCL